MTKKTLRALIVDDENLARHLVREYLRPHADIEIVGESEHGLDAVRDITALNPDLIFLDIQMPKLSGLEVLELTGRRSGVIFTTAYDQYALQAFDLHAVDYLLKPFSQTRFDEALARARQMLGRDDPGLTQVLAQPVQKLGRILIRDRTQVHVLPVAKVESVQAQDDYVSIRCDGREHLKTQSLTDLAAQLDAQQFVRVHRSYLLNIAYLQSLERASKDSFVALTRSGQKIPISRSGYERLREMLDKA